MTEIAALLGRHVRGLVRSRLARMAAILFLLGLVAAVYVGSEAARTSTLTVLVALLFLTMLAAGAAAGTGAVLPEDRIAGREEWLATLAPPVWKRRLAVALAGWLLATGLGLLGGAIVGGTVAVLRPDARLHRSRSLPLHARAVIQGPRRGADQGPGWTLSLPPHAADESLELVLRPLYRQRFDGAALTWHSDARQADLETSGYGPIRIDIAPHDTLITVASRTRGVNLRVLEARLLGSTRSPFVSLTLAGLLIGLLAGSVAPVAVLISRGTTGQTAAAAAFCLLLFGAIRSGLLTLASDLDLQGASAVAPAVLRGVSLLAPEAPLFHVLGETTALRSLEGGVLPVLVPVLIYTVVAMALAAAPLPARWTQGVNS